MRILVLGANGMLGNAILRVISQKKNWLVYGTVRNIKSTFCIKALNVKIIHGVFADLHDSLMEAFLKSQPNIVVNCVGLVKQHANAENPLDAIPINGILPHRLAAMCELIGARLIHISTDCVFSGGKGNYSETDLADAQDLYGRSKLIGEVSNSSTITLRTSIIGHAAINTYGLIDWFLQEKSVVKGYTKAIFSGLPTNELARVIRDFVIPNKHIHGIYHVASSPISKHDLLVLVNKIYSKGLKIQPDDTVRINRTLNATRFMNATGYVAPQWPDLINEMYAFFN